MRWLTLAVEETSESTVGPSAALVLWTILALVLTVLVLTVLVRWARRRR